MARTLSELRTLLTENTAYDLDNSAGIDGVSATTAELITQLNTAARWISIQLYQVDPSISLTTVADQVTYNLRSAFSRKIVTVFHVVINGNTLRAPDGSYGLWTLPEVETMRPTWRTDAHGVPTKAWQIGELLYLHQKPADAYSNSYVSGQYMCANLATNGSDDSSYYDLPEEVHEAIAYSAAVFAAVPSASDEEALNRLAAYDARAAKWIAQVGQRNRENMQATGSNFGAARWRHVRL